MLVNQARAQVHPTHASLTNPNIFWPRVATACCVKERHLLAYPVVNQTAGPLRMQSICGYPLVTGNLSASSIAQSGWVKPVGETLILGDSSDRMTRRAPRRRPLINPTRAWANNKANVGLGCPRGLYWPVPPRGLGDRNSCTTQARAGERVGRDAPVHPPTRWHL